jgi:hypothetical protein
MECKRAKNNGEAGDRNLGLPHVRIESCKADALPLSHIPESICVVLNYDKTRDNLVYILDGEETVKSLPLFFPANHRALTFTWRIFGPSARSYSLTGTYRVPLEQRHSTSTTLVLALYFWLTSIQLCARHTKYKAILKSYMKWKPEEPITATRSSTISIHGLYVP